MITKQKFAETSILILGILFMALPVFTQSGEETINPKYKRAAYAHESTQLKNDHIQLNVFKRVDGWGWGEIYTSSGKFMAVLEHLGEIMLRDQDIPIRFVAESYERVVNEEGESLVFQVKSVVAREILEKTSFDNWMRYPFLEPAIVGEVTLTVSPDQAIIYLKYRLRSTGNYYAKYIRGPWLKVGEASFGTKKQDAILPGVDWAINEEWTSGTDWFKDPWAKKYVPHPNKVSIPVMAVSHEGTGIGLSWDPNQVATRWFNYRPHVPQPVFASPNFIDRMNNQLMGLMVPDATIEGHENEVYADIPLELKIDQLINFDAEIWLSEGSSLEVITDWIDRHGLPEPEHRWTFEETLDKIANAYNTNLWHEGEGFGIHQRPGKIHPNVPGFLDRYIKENKKTTLGKELKEKVDWSRSKMKTKTQGVNPEKKLLMTGDELLKLQREDGSFVFDPEGRHYKKDDFMVATSFIEPMGLKNDTALDLIMLPAIQLLDIANKTGEEKYANAAKKAFDYCMYMTRPEAGDFWETPIHAANLLAAGHAAIGYYEAYRKWGDEKYKEKAIHWIRSLIPFTHLWDNDEVQMLYNTKPVLSSSDWYFANWVRDHVQWEVLRVFSESSSREIYWADIDTKIDWDKFHEGITSAAIQWMIVHTEDTWRPHNLPDTWEGYINGDFDYCYPDTHNSTTGMYGGMFIPSAPIAANIYYILDRKEK